MEENDIIISGAISKNDNYLIINSSHKNPQIHLWCLKSYLIIRSFNGHFQENFTIRCSFGGIDESLIACGGEGNKYESDGNINIWHRNQKSPIEQI